MLPAVSDEESAAGYRHPAEAIDGGLGDQRFYTLYHAAPHLSIQTTLVLNLKRIVALLSGVRFRAGSHKQMVLAA